MADSLPETLIQLTGCGVAAEIGLSMITEKIASMLESEMEASRLFSQRNFGLSTGDDFPEIVRELSKSERVAATLMCGLLMAGLCGKEVAESLKPNPMHSEKAPALGLAIINHQEVFKTPLEMFYWGIKIGRELQKSEIEILNSLE